MLDDVQSVAEFYASRRGRLVSRLLRQQLQGLWPNLTGQVVLGLGHATPFLPLWRDQARLYIDASTGPVPPAWAARQCVVQDDELPFPDRSIHRVLMVHALEHAANASRMLRAVGRAMRDDGRLLLLVPNRTGLWAHSESTPFADGAPYSVRRIQRILAHGLFRVEVLRGALYTPPADLRPVLRLGGSFETLGRRLPPSLAGLLLVEAVKDVYAGLPAEPMGVLRRNRVLMPLPNEAVPAGRLTGRTGHSMNPAPGGTLRAATSGPRAS